MADAATPVPDNEAPLDSIAPPPAIDAGMSIKLPFLAVGRVKDALTLATFSPTDKLHNIRDTEDIFKQLLKAARKKLKPGQRTRLQWNDGSVCCLMDNQGDMLYCVVTSFMNYPERFAYQLLRDFSQVVSAKEGLDTAAEGELNVLRPQMQELLEQYEKSPDMVEDVENGIAPTMDPARLKAVPSGSCKLDGTPASNVPISRSESQENARLFENGREVSGPRSFLMSMKGVVAISVLLAVILAILLKIANIW